MADLLHGRVGNNDGGARRELPQVFHRIHVEVNLIWDTEPHMRLCPPRHAFDVEVMKDVYVIGGAVATAGPATEREGRHHVVVHAAQRPDRKSTRLNSSHLGISY